MDGEPSDRIITMSNSWITVRIAKKALETEDIAGFELVDPEGGLLPAFNAGSHIDVEIAPGLVRQYSLCNDPRERNRYQIAVLREAASRGGSVKLVDTVSPGALIRISSPRNHFALEPTAARVVLMAGGIGITPILSMAEELTHKGVPFRLHYCSRSRSRTAFQQRIRGSAFSDLVHFHFDDEQSSRLDLAEALKRPNPHDHLYVCGPAGFIDAVLKAAPSAGWSAEQVHREFFAPVAETMRAGDEPFTVEIASSGARYSVPTDKSIVDVLAANGFDIPVSCEQGVCGTCLTKVLRGVPDHRDMFMTDQEHARNDQMTPCCSRSKTVSLVLDL